MQTFIQPKAGISELVKNHGIAKTPAVYQVEELPQLLNKNPDTKIMFRSEHPADIDFPVKLQETMEVDPASLHLEDSDYMKEVLSGVTDAVVNRSHTFAQSWRELAIEKILPAMVCKGYSSALHSLGQLISREGLRKHLADLVTNNTDEYLDKFSLSIWQKVPGVSVVMQQNVTHSRQYNFVYSDGLGTHGMIAYDKASGETLVKSAKGKANLFDMPQLVDKYNTIKMLLGINIDRPIIEWKIAQDEPYFLQYNRGKIRQTPRLAPVKFSSDDGWVSTNLVNGSTKGIEQIDLVMNRHRIAKGYSTTAKVEGIYFDRFNKVGDDFLLPRTNICLISQNRYQTVKAADVFAGHLLDHNGLISAWTLPNVSMVVDPDVLGLSRIAADGILLSKEAVTAQLEVYSDGNQGFVRHVKNN